MEYFGVCQMTIRLNHTYVWQQEIMKNYARNGGGDGALTNILLCMAHELTHYFQWINSIKLTPIGKERQATNYADYVLEDYAETREHP